MRELVRNVLLIVPTHDHADLLPLALASVQDQTSAEMDIVVIGDGVGDDTRDAVAPFVRADDRIEFLDLPKGERHGEAHRDAVIRRSRATVVTYLGDDDLMFPHHVQTMLDTLAGRIDGDQFAPVQFASAMPVFINADGTLHYIAMDLEFPGAIAWHLDAAERRNSVSLSGATHTRESYLRLPRGWRPAPAGRWSDHYMWEVFFSSPGFTGRTARCSTIVKLHSSQRQDFTPRARLLELAEFATRLADPQFQKSWNRRVDETIRVRTVANTLTQTINMQRMQSQRERMAELQARVAELEGIGADPGRRHDRPSA